MANQLSLTLPQFVRRLQTIDRVQPVGLITITVPAMRKTENQYFGRVIKISHITGFINSRYSRSVNRQRTREGKAADFHAKERAWGEKISERPIVEYAEQVYLEVKLQARKSQLRHVDTGEVIPPEAINRFLRPRPKNTRQRLDREVILKDFRVDHVAELRIAGEVWRIRRPWNRLQKLIGEPAA